MASDSIPASPTAWHVTSRWQQYAGEIRANLLRIVGVGVFYCIHLLTYLGGRGTLSAVGFWQLEGGSLSDRYHLSISLICLAWVMAAAGVLLCLANHVFPRWLSVAVTGVDVLLLTSVLCIADGPRSPLVVGYFLILAVSTLRFQVALLWWATVASLVGYLCVLGCAKWPTTFGRGEIDLTIPRYQQLITLAAIGLAGIVLGQVVRQARSMAEDYSSRSRQTEVSELPT